MESTSFSAPDFGASEVAELAASVVGPVLLPTDPDYAVECATYNLNNPLAPAVVVGVTSAADVQAAVRFAARHGMPVAVRGTGHQVVSPARGSVLLNTTRMTGVHIDQTNRVARVEPGVLWSRANEAAAKFGLAAISGSAMTVGVVGYTLGGGQSPIFGRSKGYAADYVDRIEVVTADGGLRDVTAENEPELFWALRGGKGNFGVVTALEFGLFPVTGFYGGGMYFAGERMAEVLHTWREWAADLPEEATTSVAVQRLPPVPELPEPLAGAFVLHVRFAYLGPAAEGERLLAPIRAVGPSLLDLVTQMPYTDVGTIHMDPPAPMPYYDRTTTLRELSRESMDAFIELTGPDSDCPLLSVEIRALGGALDRQPAVPNAVATRGIPFVVFGVGVGGPDQGKVMRAYLDKVVRRLEPWTVDGRRMLNFLSADEAGSPEELRAVYGAERYDRLVKVKKTYDPSNMFRMNHNIVPT
jgi:FAD/FMN-containing dehydrogenase